MKFLFVKTSISIYGGLEMVFEILLNKLNIMGHDFRFIVTDYKGVIEDESKWVKPFSDFRSKIFFWVNDKNIEDLIEAFDPDFVICTNFLDCPKVTNNNFLIKRNLVYWDHGTFASNYIKNLIPLFNLENVDLFLSISSGINTKITNLFPSAKSYLIYNPINPYNGNLAQHSKEPRFIYIGRLEDNQKNLSFLLRGLSLLSNKDWKLKIIGKGPDELKLKELSKKLNIDSNIEWAGFRENPFENLGPTTALLLTSRFEGFAMVLVEANQRGIPVISSNCDFGSSDIILNGKNGYLYEEGNIQDFVQLMNAVIEGKLYFDSPEEIAKTTKRFDVDIYMEKFLSILKNFKENPNEKKKLLPNLDEKINNFFYNNNSFIIFGAGGFGEKVKYMLGLNNKRVAYFVDNDIKKMGKVIGNIEIKHPSQIKQFEHKIIIASMWREKIAKQLEKDYNLQYLVDYI